jgi:hypothetical protein
MIGLYARDLLVGDVILGGVGKVLRLPSKPDKWGEITVVVAEEDGKRFLIKLEEDFWLRIEREEAE